MKQRRPIVIHADHGTVAPGPPTPGMERRQIMEEGNTWVGWARTEARLAGGWHHHGDRDTYVYVVRGDLTIDYGPRGREQVQATAGDMIFNPARMVHRETTGDAPAEVFLVRVGTGPHTVNVDGPDSG
jgi:mannose-6-phosphate isomerase-like protein (cupin superfamily)